MATFIGTICGTIANGDPKSVEFKQKMDELNYFLEDVGAPKEMRIRLRDFFVSARELRKRQTYNALYDLMSPGLRGDVKSFLSAVWNSTTPARAPAHAPARVPARAPDRAPARAPDRAPARALPRPCAEVAPPCSSVPPDRTSSLRWATCATRAAHSSRLSPHTSSTLPWRKTNASRAWGRPSLS